MVRRRGAGAFRVDRAGDRAARGLAVDRRGMNAGHTEHDGERSDDPTRPDGVHDDLPRDVRRFDGDSKDVHALATPGLSRVALRGSPRGASTVLAAP